jgi:hypothetical protein
MKKNILSFAMILLVLGCLSSGGQNDSNEIVARTDLGLSLSSFSSSRYSLEPDDKTTLSLIVINGGPIDASNITALLYNYGTSISLDEDTPAKVDLSGDEVLDDPYSEAPHLSTGEFGSFVWELNVLENKAKVSTNYLPKATVCYSYKTFATHEVFLTDQEWNAEAPTLLSNVSRGPLTISLDARNPIRGDESNERIKISVSKQSGVGGFFTNGLGTDQGTKNYISNLVVSIQNDAVPGELKGVIGFTGECVMGDCEEFCSGNTECEYFPRKEEEVVIRSGDFTCTHNQSWQWECFIPDVENLFLVHGDNRNFVLTLNTDVPEEDFQKTLKIRTEVLYKHCIGAELESPLQIKVEDQR